jgi:hypothetical protein
MTHDNSTPDAKLPKFSVNVAPVDDVTTSHLRTLLSQFRSGDDEPLVFGRDNTPEAAVIPFSTFVRLLKHDHAASLRAEAAFQADLSERIQASDATRGSQDDDGLMLETDEDLFRFTESLGEVGREWAAGQRDNGGSNDDR